ncbi:hypothetical protein ACJX0J_039304, partial [Zea mays]
SVLAMPFSTNCSCIIIALDLLIHVGSTLYSNVRASNKTILIFLFSKHWNNHIFLQSRPITFMLTTSADMNLRGYTIIDVQYVL